MCIRIAIVIPLIVIGFFVVMAMFAPWVAPYAPTDVFQEALRLPPGSVVSPHHIFLLGTDDLGRDLLSRLIYGARVSLGIGFFVVLISSVIGTCLGLTAALGGEFADAVIMRGVDVLMTIPSLLFAVVVVACLGPSLQSTIIAVSIVGLPGLIRVVRALALTERKKSYVEAASAFGIRPWRMAVFTILPNCLGPLLVQITLGFSDAILNASALGFLGLGAQPPTPEWGAMLADGRGYIESAWWMVTLPGLCILIVVLAFNLLGDRIQQVLFPMKRV